MTKDVPLEMEGWCFTRHAIDRYRERSGCTKSDETIMRRMVGQLANRRYIGQNQWYALGRLFVLKGNVVVTVMRPRGKSVLRRIYVAHRRRPVTGIPVTEEKPTAKAA